MKGEEFRRTQRSADTVPTFKMYCNGSFVPAGYWNLSDRARHGARLFPATANSITVASREQSLIVPFHFLFIQAFLRLSSFLAIDSSFIFFIFVHFPSRLVLSFIFSSPFQRSLPYLFVLFSPLASLPAVLRSSFIPSCHEELSLFTFCPALVPNVPTLLQPLLFL